MYIPPHINVFQRITAVHRNIGGDTRSPFRHHRRNWVARSKWMTLRFFSSPSNSMYCLIYKPQGHLKSAAGAIFHPTIFHHRSHFGSTSPIVIPNSAQVMLFSSEFIARRKLHLYHTFPICLHPNPPPFILCVNIITQ
jgi:hypothetical protein